MRRRRTFWSDKGCDACVEEVVVGVVEMGGGESYYSTMKRRNDKNKGRRQDKSEKAKSKVPELRLISLET